MEYKKPQATIIQGNVGIYPLTTADQVILADGTRLEKDGKINVDVANSADSAKLGGKAPEYYLQPRNLMDNALIKLATISEYAEVVIEPSEGHNVAGAYWAALYEGSYTADTLPPYVPKGYAAELAECQRYYMRGVQAVTIGKLYDDGGIFALDYPQMRITKPTITLLGIDSQGWGNVDINNYTMGWDDDYGSKHSTNFVSTVTADVGKTVVVKYESITDL